MDTGTQARSALTEGEAHRPRRAARASASLRGLRVLRRHGAVTAENLLVHGDNLEALRALAPTFTGKVRCAYLDPPYATGRTFAEYDDTTTGADWAAMMRPRLEAVRALLADDGAIFVQIDDTELANLLLLMDQVFGAENRVSTITVVRSAPTGHKAKNRGPVHVSDFVLLYARDKRAWRYRPAYARREGLDPAYATWLDNPEDEKARWTFRPLRRAVAEALGHASPRAAVAALGRTTFEEEVTRRALEAPDHVVRAAQPRYEAIGKEARKVVDRSRAKPDHVFVLEREGAPDFIVRGGNRLLFLADKVRTVDGAPVVVEPLTNVWTDVPFQGIAREGGVVFVRNKKPERLLARILTMASDPGDWVLDPFVGSGTTAAVAHKLGRRWIGVERGEHVFSLAEPRLRRVVAGEDPTGITADTSFRGGGGFRVATL